MHGAYCMPIKARQHITSRYMNYMFMFKAQQKLAKRNLYIE